MKTADLYIRVSTDEQAERGYSQRDQEERLRKYCQLKNIEVRWVFFEDHSAKTFNRPQWQNYLSRLKKIRNNTSGIQILFTKWDRFSRNAGDAYQMINTLRKLGVEPEAIEQPLDLSIPENKIMLAFYLAAPEVENDRRALNTFHGMRRAKKEGRYMGPAPLGYVNRLSEDKKKYIGLHEIEAPVLKWAFEQVLENRFNTEQIWKQTREKVQGKYRFSRNAFWIALRNPLYCGKMFIPPYKEEAGHFVYGQHEALITEATFYSVQDILDGRKRTIKPKVKSHDNLPLRGFLKCPKCNRMLTGSASKGKMGKYYYYYHCSSECGVRFRSEATNEIFQKQLNDLIPKKEYLELFKDAFILELNEKNKSQDKERTETLKEIELLNTRLKNALIQKVDGELSGNDYTTLKTMTAGKINNLESKLSRFTVPNLNLKKDINTCISNIYNIKSMYNNGTIEEKRLVVSSMFPENLVFDGTQHRTPRINAVIQLIYQNINGLAQKKSGIKLKKSSLSPIVTLRGIEPRFHP